MRYDRFHSMVWAHDSSAPIVVRIAATSHPSKHIQCMCPPPSAPLCFHAAYRLLRKNN
jgi:hypothetical protein